MNDKIKELKKELEEIKNKITKEFEKEFDKIEEIKQWATLVENANDYMYNEFGEISQWVRCESVDKFKEYKVELNNYLSENDYFFYIDFENSCLISQGRPDEIVINHEGHVFLEHNVIIDKSEYETEEERNTLIENYMESTGCFPGVFYQDYYGNLEIVNTKNKE